MPKKEAKKTNVPKNHQKKKVSLKIDRKDQPFVKNVQKIILTREKEKESVIAINHLIKEKTEAQKENLNRRDQHREAILRDRMEKNVMKRDR